MKVIISSVASKQLQDIFQQHKSGANQTVAKTVTKKIVGHLKLLKKSPYLADEEKYLLPLNKNYRKLIRGNYKIIYRVADKEIWIENLFESRLEPIEMVKNL